MIRYGVIYKITYLPTNQVYVGQTLRDSAARIKEHFHDSCNDLVAITFRKDRNIHDFHFEELITVFDRESLNFYERFFIQQYSSVTPGGLNSCTGGASGRRFSQLSRQKMPKVRKGFNSPARKKVHAKMVDTLKTKIIATNIKDGLEICFYSIADCSDYLKLNGPNVSRVLSGKQRRTQHKGWKFKTPDGSKDSLPTIEDKCISINKHNKYVVTINKIYLGSYPTYETALKIQKLYKNHQYQELINFIVELKNNKLITIYKSKYNNIIQYLHNLIK